MSETLNIEFISDAYLSDNRSLFWKIKINGIEIANTLRNGDKMWITHEAALMDAKKTFLEWLSGQPSFYFVGDAKLVFAQF